MSLILHYSEDEKNILERNWKHNKEIGKGSEGTCYLVDNEIFKVYNEDYVNHNINNYICRDDLDLESFLFPIEIYTCNNKVFACKTKYINNNFFDKNTLYFGITTDLNKLKEALIPFIKDVYELSKNNIVAKDLPLNTMFDGEKLYAIDTLSYKKVNYDPYEENINLVKDIIELYIESYEFFYEELNGENKEFKDECRKLIPYIESTSERIKEEYSTAIQRK